MIKWENGHKMSLIGGWENMWKYIYILILTDYAMYYLCVSLVSLVLGYVGVLEVKAKELMRKRAWKCQIE